MEGRGDRPILITIVAVIYALVAIVTIVGAIIFLLDIPSLTDYIMEHMEDISQDAAENSVFAIGAVMLVVGIFNAIIAAGLFKGWKIMWYLGVIILILQAIGCLLSIMSLYPIGLLLIDILLLYYLFRPKVKAFFGI